jgi:subtilisin family serine protease
MTRKQKQFKQLITCLLAIIIFSSTLLIAVNPATPENNEAASSPFLIKDDEPNSVTLDGFSLNSSTCITLITGDVVVVSELPTGQWSISINPADPSKSGQHFQTFVTPEGTYVIPSSANLEKLDSEFFNIDYLAKNGYHNLEKMPIIVSFKDEMEQAMQSVVSSLSGYRGTVTASLPRLSFLSAQLPIETINGSVRTILNRNSVKKIWLDRMVHGSLSESVSLIGAPELWDAGYDGTGVEIAILDTGIDATHPNLDDLDDDPATTDPKVIRAIDFTDDNTINDLDGHGTHCAGIAAGTEGTVSGFKGVAPGAHLWNVKVLNRLGTGQWSWLIEGIAYAAFGPDGTPNTGDEADVISMSLGASPTDGTDPASLAVDVAVDAGVVVVVAAGNNEDYFEIESPGASRKCIAVGASNKYDSLADLSSKGPTIDFRVKPDILAPGVDIFSSAPYSVFGSYYRELDGTSMATPHVAGTAALLLQKGVPAGWVAPEYMKNALISTAVDLGYNIYEQGGGRVSVPSAAYTEVLVDPATVSFGLYSSDTLDTATLTFHNLNPTSSHSLNLDVMVEDVSTGAVVDCAFLDTTLLNIEPGSQASVVLTIDTSSLKSMYSGKVTATIDTGETIQAIFGFAGMNELTVSKVDMDGVAAPSDEVYVLADSGFPSSANKQLDIDGDATFYVSDGTYDVISVGYDEDTGAAVYTIAEDVTVTQDAHVQLDERHTRDINFNANKPNQVMAEKTASIFYENEQTQLWINDIQWYPTSALTYVSLTSINTEFTYSYYPEAYYNSANPGLVNAPEWHKLLFTLGDVTGNVLFLPDYDALVRRETDYKVEFASDTGYRVQFALSPMALGTTTYGWQMTVPQTRIEWLSPAPVEYNGWYTKYPTENWDFTSIWQSYPIGETYFAFGEHPLTSGAEVYVGSWYLRLSGSISADTFGNLFADYTKDVSGTLTLIEDGLEVYSTEIWDHFLDYYFFSGTPEIEVVIDGVNDLSLSTSTHTELSFTADSTTDWQPPRLVIRPRNLDLFCVTSSDDVLVDVSVLDDSPISLFTFEYSLDDGNTWNLASSTQQDASSWVADLGALNRAFVSVRVNATDSFGNRISQTTIRGFSVVPLMPLSTIRDRIFDAPSNTVYFVNTGNIWDDSVFYAFYAYKQNPQNFADKTQNEVDNEHLDENGKPLFTGDIVTFGGRIANRVVRYFEDHGAALVGYEWNGTHHIFKRLSDGFHLYSVDGSSYNEDVKDYFVFQVYLDEEDHFVLSAWGLGAKGTYAGGVCFIDQIWPNLESYVDSYYIYSWTDLNGNGAPEPAEISFIPLVP